MNENFKISFKISYLGHSPNLFMLFHVFLSPVSVFYEYVYAHPPLLVRYKILKGLENPSVIIN